LIEFVSLVQSPDLAGVVFGLVREGREICDVFNLRVEGVPCVNGKIELFRGRKDGKVPEGAVEITILKTAANGDGLVGGDTCCR
jgi:hypothetical protein